MHEHRETRHDLVMLLSFDQVELPHEGLHEVLHEEVHLQEHKQDDLSHEV